MDRLYNMVIPRFPVINIVPWNKLLVSCILLVEIFVYIEKIQVTRGIFHGVPREIAFQSGI